MSKKLIGQFVYDKLSGRKGIVLEKLKKRKGVYAVRFFMPELGNWVAMDCPRKHFRKGETKTPNKIGFK